MHYAPSLILFLISSPITVNLIAMTPFYYNLYPCCNFCSPSFFFLANIGTFFFSKKSMHLCASTGYCNISFRIFCSSTILWHLSKRMEYLAKILLEEITRLQEGFVSRHCFLNAWEASCQSFLHMRPIQNSKRQYHETPKLWCENMPKCAKYWCGQNSEGLSELPHSCLL